MLVLSYQLQLYVILPVSSESILSDAFNIHPEIEDLTANVDGTSTQINCMLI